MSLGGLALGVGMLVDNSIVVLENIFRHRELGLSPKEAAAVGAEEVQTAVTASTLTTIAVFGPIIYVEGVAGELFGDLSFAVAFALLASLVVALTLLPAMAARWVAGPAAERGKIMRRLRPIATAPGSGRRRGATAPFFAALRRGVRASSPSGTTGCWSERSSTAGASWALRPPRSRSACSWAPLLDRDVLPDVDQGAFTVRLDAAARHTTRGDRGDGRPDRDRLPERSGGRGRLLPRRAPGRGRRGRGRRRADSIPRAVDVRLREGASTPDAVERLRPRLAGVPA